MHQPPGLFPFCCHVLPICTYLVLPLTLSSSLACLRRTVYSTICISADKAVSVNRLWAKTGGKEEELLGNAHTRAVVHSIFSQLLHLADHTGYLPQVISQLHICSFHNDADHKCLNHYLPKDMRAVDIGRKLVATSRRHEGSGTWQLVSGCWLGPLLAISCSNLLFVFPIHINIAVSVPNMLQTKGLVAYIKTFVCVMQCTRP